LNGPDISGGVSVSKRLEYVALDMRVLAVAVEGSVGDWTAYIGAVAGKNHAEEYLEVVQNGSKLYQPIAEILFPDFAKTLVWRD